MPPASALGGGAAAVLGVTALLALPVLFAAFIFSTSIARETALAPVLASNLTGAVLGGLLENASLLFGIAALNLLVVALYALSIRGHICGLIPFFAVSIKIRPRDNER